MVRRRQRAEDDLLICSRLLRTEITGALRRTHAPVKTRDEVLDHLATLPVDRAVLQEAEAIIPQVKTPVAIHLASALRSGLEDIVIAPHDHTMARLAAALGLRVHDPVTDDAERA